MNVIIVDDEPLAREVLEAHLSNVPGVEHAASFPNAIEAGEFLREKKVDLILLDIQMPSLSGLEFVKTLSNSPKIVFTTAYPKYAVEGFELNAVDYLVKPISFERFYKAVQKVKNTLGNSEEDPDLGEEYTYVKADKKLQKVFFKDIFYIEGLKDYVIIKLKDERIVTLQTMKSLSSKLPEKLFRRIHRSYIINLDHIDAVYGNVVEMQIGKEDKHIPIGKNYREELLELINKHKL